MIIGTKWGETAGLSLSGAGDPIPYAETCHMTRLEWGSISQKKTRFFSLQCGTICTEIIDQRL